MENEEIKKFLKELGKLTEKYNIEITGCGCCGSPQLNKLNEICYLGYNLSYNKTTKCYEIDGDDK